MNTISQDTAIIKAQRSADLFLQTGEELLIQARALEIQTPEDVLSATTLLKNIQQNEKGLEEERLKITKPINAFLTDVNAIVKTVVIPTLEAKNLVKQKTLAYNQEQERIRKEEEDKRLQAERERLQKLEEERVERERIEAEKRAAEQAKLEAEQERLRKLDEERIAKEAVSKKLNEAEEKKLKDEAEKQRIEREKLNQEKLDIERQKREAEEENKRIEEEKKVLADKKEAEEKAAAEAAKNKVKGIVKNWQWELLDESKVARAYCSPDSKKINAAVKAGIREIDGVRVFESTTVR